MALEGSGKSTTGKLININHISNGVQQIFLDPEEEYKDMINLNNGQYVDLGKLTANFFLIVFPFLEFLNPYYA